MGFFDSLKLKRLKEGLAKTRENIFGKVKNILLGKNKIDEEFLERLEEVLLSADIGVETTQVIISNLKERVKKEGYDDVDKIDLLLRDEIFKIYKNGYSTNDNPLVIPLQHRPHVIMVVGVNGVGKTTSVGKLAYNYKNSGQKVIIAAADTFRAAANEQLGIWANRAGVDIIKQLKGADPASVAYDTLKSAISSGIEVMIIDTAGRLHTKANLMEELKKIKRVLQKILPQAPHEVLLVLDASTGQNAIQQARQFSTAVGVTGLILTKLDGTAKGGVVLAICKELNIPVRYIGVGEQIDDLQTFNLKTFIEALFEGST